MPHQILVKALLNPSYYITERILIAMTQPEQSRKPRIAHQSTERMNELRAQQKSFALQNMRSKGLSNAGLPFKATGHKGGISREKCIVSEASAPRACGWKRPPFCVADLPCEPPLDDATLRIGSTGRVYIRPLPGDAADGTIHISTFFTETVAGLLAFHIPSAHGELIVSADA